MDSKLNPSQILFLKTWGDIAGFWGMNKIMGKMYALLFSSTEPLTLDDLCEKLQISRGNASMNIRALLKWDVIKKIRNAGDRKDYYVLDEDMSKIIAQFIRERKKRELEPALRTMEKSATLLRKASRGRHSVFLKRLEEMYKIGSAMDEVLESFISNQTAIEPATLKRIPVKIKQRMAV